MPMQRRMLMLGAGTMLAAPELARTALGQSPLGQTPMGQTPLGQAPLAQPPLVQTRFPERPIEVIVGFTAGGGTDIMARTYARFLEQRLGGPVVVQNRAGAGGEVAFAAVARARPDGHTLIATTMPAFLTIPIERQAQYQAAQFAPVGLIATDPSCITVHDQSPVRTLADLIDRAKREPGAVTYGSPGIGSDDHLQLVLLQLAAGIQLTNVNFPGSSQIRTALLGRHIETIGLNVGEIAAAPERMRMIVQSGDRRSIFAPNVPTYKELGLDVDMSSERGIAAPAGTPPDILARLREATAAVAQDPAFIKAMEDQYTEMRFIPGEAWAEELRQRQARFEALWRRSPWREPG